MGNKKHGRKQEAAKRRAQRSRKAQRKQGIIASQSAAIADYVGGLKDRMETHTGVRTTAAAAATAGVVVAATGAVAAPAAASDQTIPDAPGSSVGAPLHPKVDPISDGKTLQAGVQKAATQTIAAPAADEHDSGQMTVPATDFKLGPGYGAGGGNWSSGSHTGMDFGAAQGSEVTAALAGTVKEVGSTGPYGNHVIIKHANGISTMYAHMSKVSVKKGERVKLGQEIGKVGSTGNSTGPHLHFEVLKKGKHTDPMPYFWTTDGGASEKQNRAAVNAAGKSA